MKVICPNCKKPGVLKIRTIKNHIYIIVDHGITQHSLGPINDLELIIEKLVNEFRDYIRSFIELKIRKYGINHK